MQKSKWCLWDKVLQLLPCLHQNTPRPAYSTDGTPQSPVENDSPEHTPHSHSLIDPSPQEVSLVEAGSSPSQHS